MKVGNFRGLGVITVALALLLAVAACGSGGDSDASDDSSEGALTIGLQTDKTGPSAPYNVQASKLVTALTDRLNESGGLLGQPVEIVEGNDESDPTKAPTVTQKLSDDGADVLFLHTGGAAIIQTKPLITQLQLPTFISTNSTEAAQGPPDNEYVYSLALPTNVWADVYCNGMENAGIENIGLLQDDSATIATFGESVLDGMKDCIEVVATETAPEDSSDLSAQVARLKEADPDAVLTFTLGPSFEITAQNALHEQMPDVPRFMTATFGASPEAWKVPNEGVLDGAVFMGSIDPNKERSEEVGEDMKELMGDDFPLNGFTAQAYDAFQLMVQAVKDAGTTDSSAINTAIQEISGYEASFGLPGLTLSYSDTKRNGADSQCGLLLVQFGEDNTPAGVYDEYEPECG